MIKYKFVILLPLAITCCAGRPPLVLYNGADRAVISANTSIFDATAGVSANLLKVNDHSAIAKDNVYVAPGVTKVVLYAMDGRGPGGFQRYEKPDYQYTVLIDAKAGYKYTIVPVSLAVNDSSPVAFEIIQNGGQEKDMYIVCKLLEVEKFGKTISRALNTDCESGIKKSFR